MRAPERMTYGPYHNGSSSKGGHQATLHAKDIQNQTDCMPEETTNQKEEKETEVAMIKCYNCGKYFDERKQEGICPNCLSYNRAGTAGQPQTMDQSKAMGQPQAKEQSQTMDQPQAKDQSQPTERRREQVPEQYRMQGRQIPTNDQSLSSGNMGGFIQFESEKERLDRKSKKLFIGLIVGVVLAITVPHFIRGLVVRRAEQNFIKYGVNGKNGDDNIEIEQVQQGTPFYINEGKNISLTVESATVLEEADKVADFPAGEKLVAVKINADVAENTVISGIKDSVGRVYIAYDGAFKYEIARYDMDEVYPELEDRPDFSWYSVEDGEECWSYFFVPAKDNDIQLYIEMCSPDSEDVVKIFEIPVAIGEVV